LFHPQAGKPSGALTGLDTDVYVFHLFLSLDALSLHLLLLFILNAAALAFLLQCFDLLFVLIPLLDPVIWAIWAADGISLGTSPKVY
jgi:TRAP-type mannitol/chloroaromatic compound transport system permease large subunit